VLDGGGCQQHWKAAEQDVKDLPGWLETVLILLRICERNTVADAGGLLMTCFQQAGECTRQRRGAAAVGGHHSVGRDAVDRGNRCADNWMTMPGTASTHFGVYASCRRCNRDRQP
jgi:hypothetical protein